MVPSPNSPTGFAIRPSSKRTKPWMRTCEAIYSSHWGERPPLDCPVAVNVVFYISRPGNAVSQLHPKRSGNDLDKLLRATLDPLGPNKKSGWGGVITNDRRIVRIVAERRFGLPERAEVELIRLPEIAEEQPDDQLLIDGGIGEFKIPESALAEPIATA